MSDLPRLASLIKSRNTIDSKLSMLIGRTAQIGNVSEYIAATIFKITLDEADKRKGYDGHFSAGTLAGSSVDVQWHPKHDGILNVRQEALPDYYLVLAGPETSMPATASPWLIEKVFLFNAQDVLSALLERKVQIGSGASVTGPLWERAEIYPVPRNTILTLSNEERRQLFLFS